MREHRSALPGRRRRRPANPAIRRRRLRVSGALSERSGADSARGHRLHVALGNAQRVRDASARFRAHDRVADIADARAQAAQIEEQRLLRRRRAGAHDRPIAQHEILHRRADPPRGVGGEAHFALRLEARRGLHQADIALLHQIAHRQAVMAEARGHRDDEAQIGGDQFVQRALVVLVAPARAKSRSCSASSNGARMAVRR